MPRGTRSGKTSQATPKNSKKTASATTPSGADAKPPTAAETSPLPARTRGRVSAAAVAAADTDTVTPKRALRKRDVSKAELTQASLETGKTTSKRRRTSPQSEQQDVDPQPTPPPPAEVHKEEEKKKQEEPGEKAPATSEPRQTPGRSTRSSGRKRRGAPTKSPPSSPTTAADSPDLSTRDPSAKKARTSEGPTTSMMSPTVVVSPLTTPASKTTAGTTTLSQSELLPTVRLTPMAELKEKEEEKESVAEPGGRPACDRSITFNPASTSKKRSAPDQTASPTEGMGDTVGANKVQAAEKGKEAAATAAIATKSTPPPPLPEPKPPTKEQLLALQRRQLLQHLDHYDLSDLASTNSLLANWPEVDAKPTAVSATSPPDAVKPSQRIWLLEQQRSNNNNADSRVATRAAEEDGRDPELSPAVNGTPDVQVTPKQQLLSTALPAPDSITTLDSFCVGSFTMSTPQTADGPYSLTDEEDRVLLEVDTIRPDVFCLRNAPPSEAAASRLRTELIRRGYQSSACPEGPAFVNPSFIFYNRVIFTEVSFHHRPVQATARKLAYRCAYPQSWRDSLHQSISTTACLLDLEAGSKERSGDAADTGPELLVSVLRHTRTGSLLLVGCLTDQPGSVDGKDGGFLSSPSKMTSSSSSSGIYNTVTTTSSISSSNCSSGICNSVISTSSGGICNTVTGSTRPLSSSRITAVSSSVYSSLLASHSAGPASSHSVDQGNWSRIPYVYCPTEHQTTTVSVARSGCLYSCPYSASGEWCPPTFKCRPDLAAVNAAGALWALQDIWDEEVVARAQSGLQNGLSNPALQNGFAACEQQTASPPFRWVLCGNLDAASTSPAYQICRDGYPSDDSITRLRVVRNVHLEGYDYMDSTSLIDMLWHAFQHPCTDVSSCYSSVIGREPPFTRFMVPPVAPTPGLQLRNCVDYIFCSSSTLHPRAVFVPPCRAVVSAAGPSSPRSPSSRPLSQHETVISLAARLGIVSVPAAS